MTPVRIASLSFPFTHLDVPNHFTYVNPEIRDW